MMPPKVILDAGLRDKRIRRWLEMRGFIVLVAGIHVPVEDSFIVYYAERENAVIATTDMGFYNVDRAIIIPHRWMRRYNKRELATKLAKLITLKARGFSTLPAGAGSHGRARQ